MSPVSAAARREVVAANLAAFRRIPLDGAGLRPASVALCVLTGPGGDTLLITRRASTLRSHAGQWALPGGRREPGESAEAAALRELAEETGLQASADAVLGLLDDYGTRSGYLITPVVVWGGEPPGTLTGAAAEVSHVYQIPLADLDVKPKTVTIPESDAPVIRLPLLGRYVHAPTAAIVHQFCRIACRGQVQRVAHYEQPVFAWR
jgi:8-oxo-dGTP pyrophosphatase MutT (NUDIX family)